MNCLAAGQVLAVGDALLALVPDAPVPLECAERFRPYAGGAELNFAVGVARLGVPSAWIGALGDDGPGRRVLTALRAEGVDVSHVKITTAAPTGLYLREWLPDGSRRPLYYRRDSAGTHMTAAIWPPEITPPPRWLHVTGITLALGEGPRELVRHAMSWARHRAIRVSVDPNFRPALWSADDAAAMLLELVANADLALLAEEDAEVMFGTAEPYVVLESLHAIGVRLAVLRLGAAGAVASEAGEEPVCRAAATMASALDPVGAGDGFNSGFVTAVLAGATLGDALTLGNYVGARAVEAVGEHSYPRLRELPDQLQGVLACSIA